MKISWVTIDRMCEEKAREDPRYRRELERSGRPLRSTAEQLADEELLQRLRRLGFDLDRGEIERLCDGAQSVQEVTEPLVDRCERRTQGPEGECEWIWLCLVTLWKRWWPDRPCLELLDDKIQTGYDQLGRSAVDAARTWLDAWSDVALLSDAAGIHSIASFDGRFPTTQSMFNWSQDIEDAVHNGAIEEPTLLHAGIAVYEDALRRFPDEDPDMIGNRRRALAEAYFQVGETDKAEGLFERWLADDPRWGWGWVGWADLYSFFDFRPKDYERAEELLRRGYATDGVRDKDAIVERLAHLCLETGRTGEARELDQEGRRLARRSDWLATDVSLEAAGGRAVARQTTRMTFGDDGLPLDRLDEVLGRAERVPGKEPIRATKVGRNEACPCGSGRKYKKCCGSGQRQSSA